MAGLFLMLDLSYVRPPVQSPTVLVKSFQISQLRKPVTLYTLNDLPLQIPLMSLTACLLSPSHKGTFMRTKLIMLNA